MIDEKTLRAIVEYFPKLTPDGFNGSPTGRTWDFSDDELQQIEYCVRWLQLRPEAKHIQWHHMVSASRMVGYIEKTYKREIVYGSLIIALILTNRRMEMDYNKKDNTFGEISIYVSAHLRSNYKIK